MTGTAPVAIATPVDVADCDVAARLVEVPLDRLPSSVLPQDWCTVTVGAAQARARVQSVNRSRRRVWLQIDPAGFHLSDTSPLTEAHARSWRCLIAALTGAAVQGEVPLRAAYLAAIHAVHSLARHNGDPEDCRDECATVAANLVDTTPDQVEKATLFVGGPHAGWYPLRPDGLRRELRILDRPLVPVMDSDLYNDPPVEVVQTSSTYVRTTRGLCWDVYEHVPDDAAVAALQR